MFDVFHEFFQRLTSVGKVKQARKSSSKLHFIALKMFGIRNECRACSIVEGKNCVKMIKKMSLLCLRFESEINVYWLLRQSDSYRNAIQLWIHRYSGNAIMSQMKGGKEVAMWRGGRTNEKRTIQKILFSLSSFSDISPFARLPLLNQQQVPPCTRDSFELPLLVSLCLRHMNASDEMGSHSNSHSPSTQCLTHWEVLSVLVHFILARIAATSNLE